MLQEHVKSNTNETEKIIPSIKFNNATARYMYIYIYHISNNNVHVGVFGVNIIRYFNNIQKL